MRSKVSKVLVVFMVVILTLGMMLPQIVLAEKVTLQMRGEWMSGVRKQAMQTVADAYSSMYPDVKINVDWLKPEKMLALLAARQPLDIAWIAGQRPGLYYLKGVLVDLAAQYLKPQGKLDYYKSRFPSGLWEPAGWRGAVLGIPAENNFGLWWINQEIMRELGFDRPKAGWTMDDFKNMVIKATKDIDGDGTPDQWGVAGAGYDLSWYVTYLYGSHLVNEDSTKSAFNTPDSIKAFQFLRDIYTAGATTPKTVKSPFDGGACLFSPDLARMKRFGARKAEIDPYPCDPPQAPGKSIRLWAGMEIFSIVKSNREKEDAAWRFTEFALSLEPRVFWCTQADFMPTDLSIVNSSQYKSELEKSGYMEWWQQFLKNSKYATNFPARPFPQLLQFRVDVWHPTIDKLAAGVVDPEEAVRLVSEGIDKIIASGY